MTKGIIIYPPHINEVSLYVGGLRETTNLYLMEKNPKYARGNMKVDVLGVKCELIIQYYLWQRGIPHECNPLLVNRPVGDWDVKVLNMNIDVKGMWSYLTEFRINKEAHHKDKNITHYTFVQPFSDKLDNTNANYWTFRHDEVGGWPVKELKFTEAYTKTI